MSAAAKYDASCASSGSSRKNRGGLGNAATSSVGICHSWSADGRCISLLKILFTNYCINDCAYCVNRRGNDIPRASFTVREVVDLTVNFYRRNYIEGLFLSSGVIKSPDYTMEQMVRVVKELRREERFNGYIHLKVIPGAARELIDEAGFYADRLSVNIELPSEAGLRMLAPDKKREDILKPMSYIGTRIISNAEEKKKFRRAFSFVPAGQSTQLIVGASPENDLQIMRLSESLYQKFNLKRVYYSAYIPVTSNPLLPALNSPPLIREHRLYQADWLLRFYGFSANEIVDAQSPYLDTDLDPKESWALRNLHLFPVEINKADYHLLLRVPGVGVNSARRIITARQTGPLSFENLQRLGVVLQRAKYFITCQGRFLTRTDNDAVIREELLSEKKKQKEMTIKPRQLPLFREDPGFGIF